MRAAGVGNTGEASDREGGGGLQEKRRCLENCIFYFRSRKYSPSLPGIKGLSLSSTLKK